MNLIFCVIIRAIGALGLAALAGLLAINVVLGLGRRPR